MAAAAGAGAAVARARRRVVSHFLSRNAVSAEQAVGFTPERRLERKFFHRMQASGVLKPGRNGTFYVDVPALDAWQNARRKRVGFAVAGVLAAIAAGVGIGMLG